MGSPTRHPRATPAAHTDRVAVSHPFLEGPHPRAFAHRGWHVGDLAGMENSLAAFRRAVDEGFHYLETDVHATADGIVVVHHDETLDRTTDAVGAVASQLWAVVRRALVAGNEPVCRLDQLLEELPTAKINIDVKADSAAEPVIELLRRTNSWDRVCLASFSERRLDRLRRLGGKRLLTSLGSRSVAALRIRAWAPWLVLAPIRGGLAQLPPRRGRIRLVDADVVRYAHRRGMEVHVWTVDSPAKMVELLDLGVDGLMTDRPDRLRRILRERGNWPA